MGYRTGLGLADKDAYISTTKGGAGWFAVHLAYYDDIKGFDVVQTGIGRYETKEDAETEARDWAEAEQISYRASR